MQNEEFSKPNTNTNSIFVAFVVVVNGQAIWTGSSPKMGHWQINTWKFNHLLLFPGAPSSVQFSRSVVSDSLRPHESQHARPPCPSPSPGVHSDSCPSSQSYGFSSGHVWMWELDYEESCSVQFSSVVQSCLTLCDPMNRSTQGLTVRHHLPEFTQTHVHRVSDAIQPSHPWSSPSPPAPNPSQHQSLFQWVNSSHEVAKVLELQL